MSTNAKSLVKISPVLAEIFSPICRFLSSRPNGCICYPRNLWGYWTALDQICKWCSYNITTEYFGIGSAMLLSVSERQFASLLILPHIGCHGNVLWGIGKRGPDWTSMNKYLSFVKKIVKIGLDNLEIIVLQAIIKKRKKSTQAKYIAWSASVPSGLLK